MDKIELTRTEADSITVREGLFNQKSLEAQIIRNELISYVNELKFKYQLQGEWVPQNGFLINNTPPVPEIPVDKKDE